MLTSVESTTTARLRAGLTLVELAVVLVILVALAGLVIPQFDDTVDESRDIAARASATEIRDAVMQYWSDCKYEIDELGTVAERRIQIVDLFFARFGFDTFNPEIALGWNGAYLEQSGIYEVTGTTTADYTTNYGTNGDTAVLDPWQRPFVIQEVDPSVAVGTPRDVRVVSAGPDGEFDILETTTSQQLLSGAVDPDDDIYVSFTLR